MRVTIKQVGTAFITAIGLIGTILGIYTFFAPATKYSLVYELRSSTNVLDINANVGKLEIFYNGKNLQSNNQKLKVTYLSISNDGDQSILISSYDPNDLPGFQVINGKLIEKPIVTSASNAYLKKNLKLSFDSNQRVTFNPIILEPADYFIVKILTISSIEDSTSFSPVGKVAGVRYLKFRSMLGNVDVRKNVFQQSIAGSGIVQLLKLIIYPLGLLLILIPILWLTISLTGSTSLKKRARIAKKYVTTLRNPERQDSKYLDFVLKVYKEEGLARIKYYTLLLKDENKLNYWHQKEKLQIRYFGMDSTKPSGDLVKSLGEIIKDAEPSLTIPFKRDAYITELLKYEIVRIEDDKIFINQAAKDVLEDIENYVLYGYHVIKSANASKSSFDSL